MPTGRAGHGGISVGPSEPRPVSGATELCHRCGNPRRKGSGTLWSTGVGNNRAYVTLMHGGDQRVLSIKIK